MLTIQCIQRRCSSTANELQTLSWLVGGAVVIGLGYFAYTKGLFDQAFDLVNNTIKGDSSSSTPPAGKDSEPASKCKAGEVEDSKGKCVKAKASTKLALSYMGESRGPYATHRFYNVVS